MVFSFVIRIPLTINCFISLNFQHLRKNVGVQFQFFPAISVAGQTEQSSLNPTFCGCHRLALATCMFLKGANDYHMYVHVMMYVCEPEMAIDT